MVNKNIEFPTGKGSWGAVTHIAVYDAASIPWYRRAIGWFRRLIGLPASLKYDGFIAKDLR